MILLGIPLFKNRLPVRAARTLAEKMVANIVFRTKAAVVDGYVVNNDGVLSNYLRQPELDKVHFTNVYGLDGAQVDPDRDCLYEYTDRGETLWTVSDDFANPRAIENTGSHAVTPDIATWTNGPSYTGSPLIIVTRIT